MGLPLLNLTVSSNQYTRAVAALSIEVFTMSDQTFCPLDKLTIPKLVASAVSSVVQLDVKSIGIDSDCLLAWLYVTAFRSIACWNKA